MKFSRYCFFVSNKRGYFLFSTLFFSILQVDESVFIKLQEYKDICDIDELAVKASVENAQRNKVADRYKGIHGDLAEKAEGKYDIITANIVADAILMLSESIEKFMHENTVYIMSGIIDTRLDDVLCGLPASLEIIEQLEDKGWICLIARKKAL